jgi:threonine synthase
MRAKKEITSDDFIEMRREMDTQRQGLESARNAAGASGLELEASIKNAMRISLNIAEEWQKLTEPKGRVGDCKIECV